VGDAARRKLDEVDERAALPQVLTLSRLRIRTGERLVHRGHPLDPSLRAKLIPVSIVDAAALLPLLRLRRRGLDRLEEINVR